MRTGEGLSRVGLVVAFGAVVALLVASFASATGASQVRVSALADRDTDAEVFMNVDATTDQIAAVRRTIRSSDDVARFAHLTKIDAYEEFTKIFRGRQDLLDSITREDLPESFRVDVRKGARRKAWGRTVESLPGVDTVNYRKTLTEQQVLESIRACERVDATSDVEVFMKVDATEAQLEAAEAAVRGEAGMTIVRVLDKDDAYAEFKRIFADKPKLRRSVTPADLPISIRIRVAGPVTPDAIQHLAAVDGVEAVTQPGAMCADLQAALATGSTPEELAWLFVQWEKTGALPSTAATR